MDFIYSTWDMIFGPTLSEVGMGFYALAFLMFIVMPILFIYLSFKFVFWVAGEVRDWWHEGGR